MPIFTYFPPMPKSVCRHVVFLAFDGFLLLDLAGPMQVFATAAQYAIDGRTGYPPEYRLSVKSSGDAGATSLAGLSIATEPLPRTLPRRTTIIVVGGAVAEQESRHQALIKWLERMAPRAERVCSVCNGAFFLARARLLEGRCATTHWADCDALRLRYAGVRVDRNAIYVRDGNVWTSAGVSAGIDLALALVEEDHGKKAAITTARRLVLYVKRPGNQSQFSDVLELAARDTTGTFADLHEWIVGNISGNLSVPALARFSRMSERTFARKYLHCTGSTPAQAVNRFRAELARDHLRSSKAPLKSIARVCGFGTVAQLNRVVSKTFGASAHVIRETA
jgi:transcriptional regulator GlxA family with amidase domain